MNWLVVYYAQYSNYVIIHIPEQIVSALNTVNCRSLSSDAKQRLELAGDQRVHISATWILGHSHDSGNALFSETHITTS